jgi:hypothetical protein
MQSLVSLGRADLAYGQLAQSPMGTCEVRGVRCDMRGVRCEVWGVMDNRASTRNLFHNDFCKSVFNFTILRIPNS